MTRLREYVPAAVKGSIFALCLDALFAFEAWVMYLTGWINVDGLVALLWGVLLGIPAAILAAALGVPLLMLYGRWLERRRT